MNVIGYDEDGVTEISLENLGQIAMSGKILDKIEIADSVSSFIFKDHSVYHASGFSVGYGGEGPHGLHKAIKMFHPDKIEDDFRETTISQLDPKKSWDWFPMKGFISAE